MMQKAELSIINSKPQNVEQYSKLLQKMYFSYSLNPYPAAKWWRDLGRRAWIVEFDNQTGP